MPSNAGFTWSHRTDVMCAYRITPPDKDNPRKMLKYCMTDLGFWRNVPQAASEFAEKFWADIPGLFVVVEQLEQTGLEGSV